MPKTSYMPGTNEGVGNMLTAFATNIQADGNALATKYGVTADEINRVVQAAAVWGWFDAVLAIARGWAASLTASRDALHDRQRGRERLHAYRALLAART